MTINRKKFADVINVSQEIAIFMRINKFVSFISPAVIILAAAFSSFGQTANIGTELTEVKIEVKKPAQDSVQAFENPSKSKKSQTALNYQILPISEVPILEGDEKLVIKFCSECKSRKFEDLGFKKMLVFFVNPASVYADFSNNFEKAFKEIEFEHKSKKKKTGGEEYTFDVPYRSIPLIFLVSDGDYKADLRKVILEKQADVIKLGEQSNLLAELPQTIQYLSKVKEVLSAPGTLNNSVAESLVQRAQFFKLDNTNCFQQPLLNDQAKLSCLSKTFNIAEFEKDLSSLSFDKYGKLVGQEAVSQLRTKYSGMNLFFDATVTVIELVGTMFKKKPLNIQISALDTGKITSEGFVSLRQIPVNMQSNTERALLIAPLKWREKDAVPTKEMLKTVSLQPIKACLQPGNNVFLVKTENNLIKQEIKKVSLSLTDKSHPNQNQKFSNLSVNLADGSVGVILDEKLWQKMKNWQKITAKTKFDYNFESVEKEFELNILPEANWQMLLESGQPIRKNGADSILRITPNTAKRECLDRIVVNDQNNQKIELTAVKGLAVEPSGIIQINISSETKEKFQSGKLNLNIYEGGAEKPSGQLSFNLFDKKPQYKISAYLNDVFGEIRGERLNEIKSVLINGQTAKIESLPNTNKTPDSGELSFSRGISTPTASVSIELAAGDVINQTIALFPPRPRIAGNLTCQGDENKSRIVVNKKSAYKPFALENCVYPSDTDEIKLILISDGDNYTYSAVNKPIVNVGFTKGDIPANPIAAARNSNSQIPALAATGNYFITAPASVMSPRRLDVNIKVDSKIREQLEDGNQIFIKISDPVRGESNWQQAELKFLRLPANLSLKCAAGSPESFQTSPITESSALSNSAVVATNKVEDLNQMCELSGNLSMIEKIYIPNGSEPQTQQSVGLTSDKISFNKLSSEKFLYLKLRGFDSKIKINLADLENQIPAPVK